MAVITGEGEWIEIPHEPRNELRIRALTWKQIKAAKQRRSTEAIASMREMGPDVMNALPKRNTADSIIDQALSDPLDEYSIDAILEDGVTGWRGSEYDAHDFDVAALDEDTARWAARTAYGLSRIEGPDAGKSQGNSAPTTAGKDVEPTLSE